MENTIKFTKRILFVGMPDTAYMTLNEIKKAGVNIVGVVPPPKSHPAYEGFANFAKNLGLNVIACENSLKEPEFIASLKELNADLAVVTSYSFKFPPEMLAVTKDGFINAHPSLLPEYRGANPYSHVLINNEKRTGVTLHFMDNDFDTGDIVYQRAIDIEEKETMGTLFNKQNILTAHMLSEFLRFYEIKQDVARIPQTIKPKNTAPKIIADTKQTRIDWGEPAATIERKIRALNPFLIASCLFKGQFVKIFTADYIDTKSSEPAGTVISTGSSINVATGDGVLQIRTLQLSSFIICDAKDFCNRFNIQKGDIFE